MIMLGRAIPVMPLFIPELEDGEMTRCVSQIVLVGVVYTISVDFEHCV